MNFRTGNESAGNERNALLFFALLGGMAWVLALGRINIADGDLWAKMALGSFVLEKGVLLNRDVFAFTPVLPEYLDHEWGAGVVFYGVLKWFGPAGLMALKIVLATGALLCAAWTARRRGCSWSTLLLLSPFGAWALLPGYAVVVRSHAFTYLFFALSLMVLEEMWRGRLRIGIALIPLMALWTNLHGGFVAGLGTISVYTAVACWERRNWRAFLATAVGCWMVTLANPYGPKFWQVLVPALTHSRPDIGEWRSLSLFGSDVFVGFRVLFLLMILSVAVGWRGVGNHSRPGLVMLGLTALLGWQSRRHGPFLGLASLAFGASYFQAALSQFLTALKVGGDKRAMARIATLGALHIGLALWAFVWLLPETTFHVLAPVGIYPVREVDILERASVEGNAAVPFDMGSYVAWRLYPKVKISMDGRYEAAFPESTFQMNQDFISKQGANWARLIEEHPVDFVILDGRPGGLRPEDLADKGYTLIWQDSTGTALLALEIHSAILRETAANLPPTTPDPLSAEIPQEWPHPVAARPSGRPAF